MNSASFKNHTLESRLLKNFSALSLCIYLCINLCGCSTTSETFDCPACQDVGCKSISEVNQMVDQQVGGKDAVGGMQSILPHHTTSSPSPIISTSSTGIENSNVPITAVPLSDSFTVQRIPEEYLRVWIAPFQDQQGNLHEGSIIHTVLKPGYWKMLNAQESSESHQLSDVKAQ
jgi:conjugal transfer pilus assembly protein TraV